MSFGASNAALYTWKAALHKYVHIRVQYLWRWYLQNGHYLSEFCADFVYIIITGR
jgi:hypothetical protein